MKLAKFTRLGPHPFYMYWDEEHGVHSELIRVSEYVDVEFPPRPPEEIVPAQVAAIDQKIAEVTQEFGEKLAALKQAKNDLLAITQQPEEV